MAVFIGFYARRAAAINLVLTHSVFAIPDDLTAAMISSYSGGETRVEMNLPRFSFLGSIGRPTFGVSVIPFLIRNIQPMINHQPCYCREQSGCKR